jgi:hypothetical protein
VVDEGERHFNDGDMRCVLSFFISIYIEDIPARSAGRNVAF